MSKLSQQVKNEFDALDRILLYSRHLIKLKAAKLNLRIAQFIMNRTTSIIITNRGYLKNILTEVDIKIKDIELKMALLIRPYFLQANLKVPENFHVTEEEISKGYVEIHETLNNLLIEYILFLRTIDLGDEIIFKRGEIREKASIKSLLKDIPEEDSKVGVEGRLLKHLYASFKDLKTTI
jgi:hypothetical protein